MTTQMSGRSPKGRATRTSPAIVAARTTEGSGPISNTKKASPPRPSTARRRELHPRDRPPGRGRSGIEPRCFPTPPRSGTSRRGASARRPPPPEGGVAQQETGEQGPAATCVRPQPFDDPRTDRDDLVAQPSTGCSGGAGLHHLSPPGHPTPGPPPWAASRIGSISVLIHQRLVLGQWATSRGAKPTGPVPGSASTLLPHGNDPRPHQSVVPRPAAVRQRLHHQHHLVDGEFEPERTLVAGGEHQTGHHPYGSQPHHQTRRPPGGLPAG